MKMNKLFTGKKSAQAMVEFAIALPVLLLLLYGILEAGRLMFVYSTVVTASRQAARYGATTGQGSNGVPRYQDCQGIRAAAQAVGYLGPFDAISLGYDSGPSTGETSYCPSGSNTDSSLTTDVLEGNRTRLVVTVREHFTPLVRLVPFLQRDITATSRRTILYSVPIVVDQQQQQWNKTPTTLQITSDAPDPSEINQSVTVTVLLKDNNNVGISNAPVDLSGADVNCQITTNNNGIGSCNVIFSNPGAKVITAIYNGDTNYLGSSDTEDHTVTLYSTTTTILSDTPDFSVTGNSISVTVQVTSPVSPTAIPTGTVTVTVDEGGSTGCTITLANGAGGCTMGFTTSGTKTIRATYNPDSSHITSVDTEPHEVFDPTPTPTVTPTRTATPLPSATPTRTSTPTPAYSPTPSRTPTAVASCNLVSHTDLTQVDNTMSMTITNPYPFPITMQDLTVTWNHDKGHQTGSDKSLWLEQVTVNSTPIWTGNVNQVAYNIPTTAIIPAGSTVTITFTFDKSYDKTDGMEKLHINLSTPGCQGNPIDGT
jgi:hypothetical protein